MRWFEVESTFTDDDKIARILQKFGNNGLAVLVRLWAHVAHKGARPGTAVDSAGEPFDLQHLADRAGTSQPYLKRLLDYAATVRHIDRDLWRDRGVVYFPAMARRAQKFHNAVSSTERTRDFRARRFDRIADRDGRFCCRCRTTEHLELERKVPKEDGGGDVDENLQVVCLSCGRKRRAEREVGGGSAGGRQGVGTSTPIGDRPLSSVKPQNETLRGTQNRTESDVLYCDPCTSTDQLVHTQDKSALARANPQRLPLVGATPPRPKLDGGLHTGHAWCGRKCVPYFLHVEFLESIGGDPTTREERLRAFYRAAIAGIPPDSVIAETPLVFWRGQFSRRFSTAEAIKTNHARAVG